MKVRYKLNNKEFTIDTPSLDSVDSLIHYIINSIKENAMKEEITLNKETLEYLYSLVAIEICKDAYSEEIDLGEIQ